MIYDYVPIQHLYSHSAVYYIKETLSVKCIFFFSVGEKEQDKNQYRQRISINYVQEF